MASNPQWEEEVEMKPTRPKARPSSGPLKDAPGMGQARRQAQDYESLVLKKKGSAPVTSPRPKARPKRKMQ